LQGALLTIHDFRPIGTKRGLRSLIAPGTGLPAGTLVEAGTLHGISVHLFGMRAGSVNYE